MVSIIFNLVWIVNCPGLSALRHFSSLGDIE